MTVTARQSPGEYAAYWGSDSSGDRHPRKYGDGALFYNFSEEGHDPDFLWRFMPAINRTLSSDEMKPSDAKQLRSLKQICRERLVAHFVEKLTGTEKYDRSFLPADLYARTGADLEDVMFVATRVSNTIIDTIRKAHRRAHPINRPKGKRNG